MSTTAPTTSPRLPPRWIIRTIWRAHRALVRATDGRLGLRPPKGTGAGLLRLNTVGRSSGLTRSVIVCYLVDGSSLVTIAMNGWGARQPAWWSNLQSQAEATVDLGRETRAVRARAATPAEHTRLWPALETSGGWGNDLDALSAMRGRAETVVVMLEPRVRS